MKKKSILIILCSFISLFSFAQTGLRNEGWKTPPKLDTVRTLCLVLVDVQAGMSRTLWLTKIFGSVYDFPNLQASDLKGDSLMLRKKLTPVKIYLANVQEEVYDQKTKKKISQSKIKQIPDDLILIDFNNNYPIKDTTTTIANKPK